MSLAIAVKVRQKQILVANLGDENIFLFGLTADEVSELMRQGYRSMEYYQRDPRLKCYARVGTCQISLA